MLRLKLFAINLVDVPPPFTLEEHLENEINTWISTEQTIIIVKDIICKYGPSDKILGVVTYWTKM